MFPFISFYKFTIPTYGLLIFFGVLVANLLAIYFSKKNNQNFDDVLLFEAYIFLGGFLGAKILYLFVARKEIDWSKFFTLDYFNFLMKGGFVFYGGLIGGLLFCFLCGKLHKLDGKKFINEYCFLIPLVHSFGRIGCFCAGCCYGKHYEGFLSVRFAENSFGPSGISVFPIQLLEALFLLLVFILLLVLVIKKNTNQNIAIYLMLYSIIRFCLEEYRADQERGMFLGFSTSQWISLFIAIIVMNYWYYIYRIRDTRSGRV